MKGPTPFESKTNQAIDELWFVGVHVPVEVGCFDECCPFYQ